MSRIPIARRDDCDFCTWRADRPVDLSRMRACSEHWRAYADMLNQRDAQEADAKDLLYSLGAP